MINLVYYKNKYFNDKIFVPKNEILDNIRNKGLKENKEINCNISNYENLSSIDLINIISDKVFFFRKNNNKDNSSIKNMLYKNKILYQDFIDERQIESYLYRLINEEVNRVLVFINNFSLKNDPAKIKRESIIELINNMDNDIIYLSDQIILVRYQVFLPWLWNCRNKPFEFLKNVSLNNNKIKTFSLINKWDFSNL